MHEDIIPPPPFTKKARRKHEEMKLLMLERARKDLCVLCARPIRTDPRYTRVCRKCVPLRSHGSRKFAEEAGLGRQWDYYSNPKMKKMHATRCSYWLGDIYWGNFGLIGDLRLPMEELEANIGRQVIINEFDDDEEEVEDW